MRTLPIQEVLHRCLDELREGTSLVLQAPPGAGKTTTLPLAMLLSRPEWLGDDGVIVVLEPRRLAARAAATRMAEILGEPVGKTVGYRVRFDSKISRDTRIEVVTEGVLARRLQRDPGLEKVKAVVFDEFHERSLDADLCLALATDVRAALRPDLRLVVMSATLDAELFCGYLGNCAAVSAPGRTHPVTTLHLERIHDVLEYSLDEDSRCCRRPAGARRGEEALSRMSERDRSAAMDAWGADGDSAWRGDENPDFDPGYYAALPDPVSARATRNLSRLDESVVDYDCVSVTKRLEPSSGARGRHSRSARARSETGARLTPRAMASLLRSRSALQRASSALRARVVGVRPVPALSSIRHRRACSTRRGARAVPRRRRSGRGHRVARPRSRLFPARVAARTRSPPRPRARPARPDRVGVSRTPRVSRRMGKQSENSQRGFVFVFVFARRSTRRPRERD